MVTSVLAAAAMGQAAAQPTDLSRVFTKGESFRYQVRTELIIERKFPALGEQTAVPQRAHQHEFQPPNGYLAH